MTEYFGKYRGTVKNNQDPNKLGRLQVSVPSVLDTDNQNWALPCVPYAGKDIGMFTIPPKGAKVWVEFEGGNRERPIWTGCFWGDKELPKEAEVAYEQNNDPAEIQVFKTEELIVIISRRKQKEGLTLEVKMPKKDNQNEKRLLKVVLNKEGIEIKNDKETLLKMTEDLLELKNLETLVDITAKQIQLKEKEKGELKLVAEGIELKKESSTANFTQDGIDLKNGKSQMQLASSGIKVSNDQSVVEVGSAIDLKGGGGAKINLSGKVKVNDGNHEVM
ncbi:MAG: phage baseplate assembly protein V [Hormoscilla sp.]